jgi:hypothetical protein
MLCNMLRVLHLHLLTVLRYMTPHISIFGQFKNQTNFVISFLLKITFQIVSKKSKANMHCKYSFMQLTVLELWQLNMGIST